MNFVLPGLRFHALQTRGFPPLALSYTCTPPVLARPRPVLARSSTSPRPASPGPRPPSFEAIVASTMSFLSLLFWISFPFSPSEDFLSFECFPFLSRDFRDSVRIQNPFLFGGLPCHVQKRQKRKGRTGSISTASTSNRATKKFTRHQGSQSWNDAKARRLR